jgi:hypothetical protein
MWWAKIKQYQKMRPARTSPCQLWAHLPSLRLRPGRAWCAPAQLAMKQYQDWTSNIYIVLPSFFHMLMMKPFLFFVCFSDYWDVKDCCGAVRCGKGSWSRERSASSDQCVPVEEGIGGSTFVRAVVENARAEV